MVVPEGERREKRGGSLPAFHNSWKKKKEEGEKEKPSSVA